MNIGLLVKQNMIPKSRFQQGIREILLLNQEIEEEIKRVSKEGINHVLLLLKKVTFQRY